MVNFSNTINYLTTQMNNETSFKQHNKERFIIVAAVKEWEWESFPFGVAGQYVGPWFVGSLCEASISMFFSDGVPSGISSSGCERCLFGLLASCSLRLSSLPRGTRKNSARGRWNQRALPVDWLVIAELLGRGIDLRKEIDLWLLQGYWSWRRKNLRSVDQRVWHVRTLFFCYQLIQKVWTVLYKASPLWNKSPEYNYTTIRIYIYTCENIINNNDKRTHFFIKIYLSHLILERVVKGLQKSWYWLCVRGELETEQTATYWPQVPLTIAAILSHSVGLLNWGSLRAASPLSGAGSHCFELQLELQLQLTPTNSNHLWHLIIYLFDVHLLSADVACAPNSTRPQVNVTSLASSTGCTCFLIDGSVEGQYVTLYL